MRPIGVNTGDGSCKKSVSGAILAAYELLFCIHVDILIARGSVEVRSVVSFYHGDVKRKTHIAQPSSYECSEVVAGHEVRS